MRTTISLVIVLLLATCATAQDNWARFRGPNGTGVTGPVDFPSEFSASNYQWTADLPGKGHSSPVVWGNKVAVTAASGAELALCVFDLASGEPLRTYTIDCPRGAMHAANSTAATTPAIDAQQIYLSWASGDSVHLAAFAHGKTATNDNPVWHAQLPAFVGQHGFCSSPVVVGQTVCLNVDTTSGGYLVAYDATNGNERWRAARPDSGKESYSTPCTIEAEGRALIVAESTGGGLQAIDPNDGTVVWSLGDVLPARTVSSPCVAGDMLIATCGSGGNGHVMVAAKYDDAGASVAYTLTNNVPYVPTILAKDGLLFLWHDQGIVTCVDAATREVVWRKRIGGGYYGSPVCVGDRLIALSREGKAVVLAASRDYKLLGESDLGEGSEATPAVAQGRLLLRTESKLICLGPPI